MGKWLPSTIGNLVADAYSALLPGVPGANTTGNVVAQAVGEILAKRSERAFHILLDEVRRADIPTHSLDDIEPALAMMLRYQRAALEGAALHNRRLMAQVFSGVSQRRPLVAEDFQNWADALQGLRRSEVIAIGEVHRYTIECRNRPAPNDFGREAEAFAQNLVPEPFRSEDELLAVCQAASRTGLIMGQGDQNLFPYASTPLMDELAKLSDFESAVRKARL